MSQKFKDLARMMRQQVNIEQQDETQLTYFHQSKVCNFNKTVMIQDESFCRYGGHILEVLNGKTLK